MPTLLIDNGHDRFGGTFHGPLLIGRRAANAVVVDDPAVDLVHAWISPGPSGYFIANIATGGRQTFVNGQPVSGRRTLDDGDVIEVGSSMRITFHHHETLPSGYRPIELSWRGAAVENVDEPIVFYCVCGATIQMTPIFSGTMSRCPQCGRVVDVPYESAAAPAESAPVAAEPESAQVPTDIESASRDTGILPVQESPSTGKMPVSQEASDNSTQDAAMEATIAEAPVAETGTSQEPATVAPPPLPLSAAALADQQREPEGIAPASLSEPLPTAAPEATPAPAARPICGICHSEIDQTEETTHCPDCGLVFHFDCWMGNWGCSSYGCPQVNAARPVEKHSVTAPASSAAIAPSTPEPVSAPTPTSAPTPAPAPARTVVATTPDLDAILRGTSGSRGPPRDDDAENQTVALVPELPLREESEPFPWEFVALGASVVALLLSALAFGLPSVLAGVVAMLMARRREIRRPGVLLACAVLVALGLMIGIAVSSFWWLGSGPPGGRR